MINPELTTENKIEELAKLSKALEPDFQEREVIRNKVIQYYEEFLEELKDKNAYVFTDDKGKELLDSPIKETVMELEKILGL